MSLSSNATKPLVLVFPCADISHYQRCLVIAQHLRPLFDIRFLHTDQQANLVYQQGFETFMGNFFPFLPSITGEKAPKSFDERLELVFLELVEILETLQPEIVISDGDYTLSMAAEFTGIPMISVMNGYQSPYFVNNNPFQDLCSNHEPFRSIREKYGLCAKNTIQDELEGELNWICDLPELFPQKELPYHYQMIGPLIEVPKPTKTIEIEKLSSFKKAAIIDLDDTTPINWLDILTNPELQGYNLTVRATDQNHMHLHKTKISSYIQAHDQLFNADILVCNTERLVYTALYYGLPVIFVRQFSYQERIIEALEHWEVGTSWNKVNSAVGMTLAYWIHNNPSDTQRTLQYKLKTSLNNLGKKLLHGISLHFPHLGKSAVTFSK